MPAVSQRFPKISCLLGAALAVGAVPAVASTPSAAFEQGRTPWHEISADFSGAALVVSDTFTAGPQRLGFVYYRAEAHRVALDGRRLRFAEPAELRVVTVSSSIASLTGTQIHGGTDGTFVLLPGPNGGAPPVVSCCDEDGRESVVESDGRPAARRVVAVGFDGDRVRLIARELTGAAQMVSAQFADAEGAKESSPFPGVPSRDAAAVADGIAVWTDDVAAGVVRIASTTTGAVVPIHDVPLGGRVLRLTADARVVAATVRVGTAVKVVRIDPATGTALVAWTGTRVPKVAVGGGSLVVADGQRLLAARSGRAVRVAAAHGVVAAVAVDGDRFAWFERRLQTRKKPRRTLALLGVVPR